MFGERLDQSKLSAGFDMVLVAPNVTGVGFEICSAPSADERAAAQLVGDACIGLQERCWTDLNPVEHRRVLEALGAVHANAAATEDVVDHKGRLGQSAARLELFEVQVLEAAESTGLEVVRKAVHQTDIELP